ncbi:P-loop containing nucleoside triphosphate hydrolase protein [Venturia nashicola]|uniref:Signal recognition particle receptor subunit alpha homolog n=1 Tax=Venturia nashicola TaxID=86259 RepID=A0A4Z1P6F9_9PEZI|nr:P-loop containing nucleoside triphosphate hydrolase protein [Venturia nashicola]
MLDSFEIITSSGVVLWSRQYIPTAASLINNLIRNVFIEESGSAQLGSKEQKIYRKDGQTLRWTKAKDLGIVFVAVYQSLLQITWIDQLLENVRVLFTELYGDQLTKQNTSKFLCPFDDYFDRQIAELEKLDVENGDTPSIVTHNTASSVDDQNGFSSDEAPRKATQKAFLDPSPLPSPGSSRPSTPVVNHLLTGASGPKGSRRSRKAVNSNSAPASSGDESSARPGSKKGAKGQKPKVKRVWTADGLADEDDGTTLDYSAPATESDRAATTVDSTGQETWGTRTKTGQYMPKDIDEQMGAILASAKSGKDSSETSGIVGSSLGAVSGLFRNFVGGKTLTKEDLAKPMKGIEDHLLKKNVAREAAVRLCDSVERDLIGMKTSSFTSIDATIRQSMGKALHKILTPTSALDLLREIGAVQGKRPYVISIVGVNGVGKSTNLSKIAFFLLQNQYRVLIAAGDTFRSGAVEQLRVHVRNLEELTKREGKGGVALYEKGYGKDAAVIAKDAVAYATQNKFDVVLIDTAGRRHNDQRLMSSLEKFGQLARPDKILMVGEALVGSDAVQQARNFDAAFGPGRRLDGFIVSKVDTVGDLVGTLVSMVHATGIPVLFLGTGQHYGDLRTLKVESVVGLLMQ